MRLKKSLFIILCCFLFSACNINRLAINAVSNALTKEGSQEIFTGDSDPVLVGDALPFAIKMYESLLEANPKHKGLLATTGSLFVMYANAFVQTPAEQLPRELYGLRQAEMDRAGKLYLRGVDLLYRRLELNETAGGTFQEKLAKLKKDDVPSLYWAAVGGLSAYSLNLLNLDLGIRIPEFISLINRAYELDPDFNSGALDEFLLLFYASVPEHLGGDKAKAETHFKLAVEKSGGLLAGPFVSYAQALSIPAQDYDRFKTCLETALSIDIEANPSNRLVNIIYQRKAQYLLDSSVYYFFNLDANDFNTDFEWDDEDW